MFDGRADLLVAEVSGGIGTIEAYIKGSFVELLERVSVSGMVISSSIENEFDRSEEATGSCMIEVSDEFDNEVLSPMVE
jgi:hypothetical protein